MMSALLPTRVCRIAVEFAPTDAATEINGPAEYVNLALQPCGVRLDNDGMHRHWISPHYNRWTLTFSGTAWRAESNEVRGRRFAEGHVLRLAVDGSPRGTYAMTLPQDDDGSFELDRQLTYLLEWTTNESVTAMGLYLSILT